MAQSLAIAELVEQVALLETQIDDYESILGKSWKVSTASFIFFMQAGFALIESGSCRSKNVLSILTKNQIDVLVGTVSWWLIGWGLAFRGAPGLGSLEFSDQSRFHFQWSFCSVTATIVSGGVAERMPVAGYCMFVFIMASVIYPVVVAWVWCPGGWLYDAGFVDFAGATVVHVTGGSGALSGAIIAGPREGRFSDAEVSQFAPHSVPFIVLGTFILLFGWYGFNCGTVSIEKPGGSDVAAVVGVNTAIAAVAGGFGAAAISMMVRRRMDVPMTCNGVLAGLVAITAGCAVLRPETSFVVGATAGAMLRLGCSIETCFGIDDPVGAFPVHCLSGIWGTLAVAIFHPGVDAVGKPVALPSFAVQLKGTLAVLAYAGATTTLVFLVGTKLGVTRSRKRNQRRGLDASYAKQAYTATDASRFAVFIAHDRGRSAVMARWLQLSLGKYADGRRSIYLEVDASVRADTIEIVREQVDWMLILVTEDFWMKPACVLQVVAASASEVPIVLMTVECDVPPDFTILASEVRDRIERFAEDALLKSGYSGRAVESAIASLATATVVHWDPSDSRGAVVEEVAMRLGLHRERWRRKPLRLISKAIQGLPNVVHRESAMQVLVLCDARELEAVAVARVVVYGLREALAGEGHRVKVLHCVELTDAEVVEVIINGGHVVMVLSEKVVKCRAVQLCVLAWSILQKQHPVNSDTSPGRRSARSTSAPGGPGAIAAAGFSGFSSLQRSNSELGTGTFPTLVWNMLSSRHEMPAMPGRFTLVSADCLMFSYPSDNLYDFIQENPPEMQHAAPPRMWKSSNRGRVAPVHQASRWGGSMSPQSSSARGRKPFSSVMYMLDDDLRGTLLVRGFRRVLGRQPLKIACRGSWLSMCHELRALADAVMLRSRSASEDSSADIALEDTHRFHKAICEARRVVDSNLNFHVQFPDNIFKPPAEHELGAPLVRICRDLQLCWQWRFWEEDDAAVVLGFSQVVRRYLAGFLEAVRSSVEVQQSMAVMYAQRREKYLGVYTELNTNVVMKDRGYLDYQEAVKNLSATMNHSIKPTDHLLSTAQAHDDVDITAAVTMELDEALALCRSGVQPSVAGGGRPSDQTVKILGHAHSLQERVTSLCERIAAGVPSASSPSPQLSRQRTAAGLSAAPIVPEVMVGKAHLKGLYRLLEKTSLSTTPGAIQRVKDLARDSLICADMGQAGKCVEAVLAFQQAGELRVVGIKDRFETPTSGGWSDLLLNLVFLDDPTLHIFEIQVMHKDLLLVRSQMGAHKQYAGFRSADEISVALGLDLEQLAEDAPSEAYGIVSEGMLQLPIDTRSKDCSAVVAQGADSSQGGHAEAERPRGPADVAPAHPTKRGDQEPLPPGAPNPRPPDVPPPALVLPSAQEAQLTSAPVPPSPGGVAPLDQAPSQCDAVVSDSVGRRSPKSPSPEQTVAALQVQEGEPHHGPVEIPAGATGDVGGPQPLPEDAAAQQSAAPAGNSPIQIVEADGCLAVQDNTVSADGQCARDPTGDPAGSGNKSTASARERGDNAEKARTGSPERVPEIPETPRGSRLLDDPQARPGDG
mmetsp:Transcript_33978/g.88616  ORF Transcript_33978/g.88616 Transcript_33978/m.88616 type:complete len:1558 (-) Transcript_33978:187-4860(-)